MAQVRNGKADTSDVAAQIEVIKSDIAALTALMGDVASQKAEGPTADAAGMADKVKQTATDQATLAQLRA